MIRLCDKLYIKMDKEYKEFIKSLKQKTPDEIIEAAYEKVMKKNILCCIEEENFPHYKAKPLLTLDYPLDSIYQQWLSSDDSFLDMLRDAIDATVDDVKKCTTILLPEER